MAEVFSEVEVLTFLLMIQFCSFWNITKLPVSFRKEADFVLSLPSMGCILHLLFPWILSLYTMLPCAKQLKKLSKKFELQLWPVLRAFSSKMSPDKHCGAM